MRFQITLELIETILETPAQGIADLTNKLIEGNYSELSLSGVLVGQINEEEDEIEEVDIIQLFTHVATILQQTKISHLDVSFNMLTKEALLHIINSIKTGTHLTSINLGFNSIDPNTAEELTAALKNHDIVQISGFDNSKGMANTVLKKAMTVFESLLTSAPTHAQQILEALFNLQQEQMSNTLAQLFQEAGIAFENIQPEAVQEALIHFCPHLVQAIFPLFPNQIAAQAAGIIGMPNVLLLLILPPIIVEQIQHVIAQLPPAAIATIASDLANRTQAELTQLFADWQQRALAWLNNFKNFYESLITECGPTSTQGLTEEVSEALLKRLNAFSDRNHPGTIAFEKMEKVMIQNCLLRERWQATALAVYFNCNLFSNEIALKIFSYLTPTIKEKEKGVRENNFLTAYHLATKNSRQPTSTAVEASQKRLQEEGANDNDSQDAGPSTIKRVKKS